MLLELETLAKLPKEVRNDIAKYCDARGYPYSTILKAVQCDEWAMAKVNGLILHLARRGHKLWQIHTAANVSQEHAFKIIQEAKKPETRIRTTDWGRIETCR